MESVLRVISVVLIGKLKRFKKQFRLEVKCYVLNIKNYLSNWNILILGMYRNANVERPEPHIHTYIIDHYSPSVKIIDLVSQKNSYCVC